MVERFAAELRAHLTPAGCALVVLSSNSNLPAFLRAFEGSGLAVEMVATSDLLSETLLTTGSPRDEGQNHPQRPQGAHRQRQGRGRHRGD